MSVKKLKKTELFRNGYLAVSESIEKSGGRLDFTYDGQTLTARYARSDFSRLEPPCPKSGYYFGHTLPEVMESSRDMLADIALARGEPGFDTLTGILPPLNKNAYSFLSGAASWSGVVVDRAGSIFPQMNGSISRPFAIFTAVELDNRLYNAQPLQMFLDACLPVMVSIYEPEVTGTQIRTIAFVEHGDPDRDPLVWIRATWYCNGMMDEDRDMYFIVTQSRDRKKQLINPDAFWNALYTTIVYWRRFIHRSAASESALSLPDRELEHLVRGSLVFSAATFTGEHPHYGHKEYGCEQHDNFPPTLITAFEAAAVWGQNSRARGMIDHLMKYTLDALGRFDYRQGDTYDYGASATEYGQLLWVLDRYWYILESTDDLEGLLSSVTSMGDNLAAARTPCPHDPDIRLIRMCAEADTHGRVYYYLNNNLWAVRGLQALAGILKKNGRNAEKYVREAEDLLVDIRHALDKYRIPSEHGLLVPFQFYYSAAPLTLSNTKKTFYPISREEYDRYIVPIHMSEDISTQQDFSENSYANYRFYPEILSTGLLQKEEEDAIVGLRENLGGELLGMTRFMDRLDDWPIFNYARHLLEADRIDKYLMILYSHALYSGVPRLMTYYEQYSPDGRVLCPDCVPALLITPLMTAWMFAHVSIKNDALHLLRAVPKRWFKARSFRANGILTPAGVVGIAVENSRNSIRVDIALPSPARRASEIILHIRAVKRLRMEAVEEGAQWVACVRGDGLVLREDCPDKITISIKKLRS